MSIKEVINYVRDITSRLQHFSVANQQNLNSSFLLASSIAGLLSVIRDLNRELPAYEVTPYGDYDIRKEFERAQNDFVRSVHDAREEILTAFAAKFQLQPEECLMVEQKSYDGRTTKWYVVKHDNVIPKRRKADHCTDESSDFDDVVMEAG